MKRLLFGFVILLTSCSKSVVTPITQPVSITPTTPTYTKLPIGYYVGKTSYQLKPAFQYVNVDSIRKVLNINTKGKWNGTGNLGYVYVDMNNPFPPGPHNGTWHSLIRDDYDQWTKS